MAIDDVAKDLMVDVNTKIGGSLCSDLSPGEIMVKSSGSAMAFDGTKVRRGFCEKKLLLDHGLLQLYIMNNRSILNIIIQNECTNHDALTLTLEPLGCFA